MASPTPNLLPPGESAQYQITLDQLGYEEQVVRSNTARIQYMFSLPETWELQEGSYLALDFSYTYQALEGQEVLLSLATFGELTILVDGEIQETVNLDSTQIVHQQVQVNLPVSLLNGTAVREHSVSLLLDATYPCGLPHHVELTIHADSYFLFLYTRLPLVHDLSLYPRPFYQRAFAPDVVEFVLPSQPSQIEVAGAVGMSARLGALTSGRMVISATTDLAWMGSLTGEGQEENHLIVIGRPETNQLISFLNDRVVLPVAFRPRQLGLTGEGPVSASPRDLLAYTFTVTNTTLQLTSPLSLTDILPSQTQLVACEPACDAEMTGRVTWSIGPLAPDQTVVVALTLQHTEPLTAFVAENTVALSDQSGNPLNVRTLTTAVYARAENVRGVSPAGSDYFFVQDGQPVAETDGIVQEFTSPWNPDRAILMVTGLTDQAVYKASRAMSTWAGLPGMAGSAALVRLVHPYLLLPRALDVEVTLADLGYNDRTMYGTGEQSIDYWFFIPFDWQLTQNAYAELRLSHSHLVNGSYSTINLLLNGKPLASDLLDQRNASNGRLRVALPGSQVRLGASNRLTVRASMNLADVCADFSADQVWLAVGRDSLLYLEHEEREVPVSSLDDFPVPFGSRSDLSDLLFALPSAPGPVEIGGALRVAAMLGNAAGGKSFSPAVVLGDATPQTLPNYHIIAVGQPSAHALIQQINAQLPQPFVPGTDTIEQQVGDVIFRLPPGISLGYVQLLESPWSSEHSLLAVTGTSTEGIEWAVQSLTDGNRRWQLSGNLAMVKGDEIRAIDTRELTASGRDEAGTTVVPGLTPVATLAIEPKPTEMPTSAIRPRVERPKWLIPLVAFVVLAIIAIFAVVAWQWYRRRLRVRK